MITETTASLKADAENYFNSLNHPEGFKTIKPIDAENYITMLQSYYGKDLVQRAFTWLGAHPDAYSGMPAFLDRLTSAIDNRAKKCLHPDDQRYLDQVVRMTPPLKTRVVFVR